MHRPTTEGAYRVIVLDEYGDTESIKIVALKRGKSGELYQYNATDDETTLQVGFGAFEEVWQDLSSVEYHIEVQKLRGK
jgi:hypothetical protein